MSKILIGVDLGGTRIKTVALDKEGNVLEQLYTPTQDGDSSAWKQATAASIEKLKSKLGVSDFVVGISAPGLPNEQNSAIAYMPGRLQGLENFDWSSFLNHRTWIINDAVGAMMAEAKLGVAKNKKNAVLITLGTGVGGAILIDGKPYQGSFQKAGHIGHISLDHEGEPDVTGMPGSLEDAIGNWTVHKRSRGKFMDTRELLDAHRKGDEFARSLWTMSVKKLAIGIASVTNILSPECVILAGGITEAGSDLFEPLEHFLSLYEWRAGGNKTSIVKSQFGDMAGAIGAACFAQMQDS
ncbi:MAG TPA: ROK family protein [Puia sp.]|nr:ROK family protein [Puia sp.]